MRESDPSAGTATKTARSAWHRAWAERAFRGWAVPVVVGLAFSVVVTSIRISGHEALRVVARDALVWFVVPFVAILIVQVAGTLADLVAVALAPVAKALVARIPEPDWAGWSRRHPITAAALKWANEEGAPFFVIGVGLLLAFAGPERRLVLAPAPQAL